MGTCTHRKLLALSERGRFWRAISQFHRANVTPRTQSHNSNYSTWTHNLRGPAPVFWKGDGRQWTVVVRIAVTLASNFVIAIDFAHLRPSDNLKGKQQTSKTDNKMSNRPWFPFQKILTFKEDMHVGKQQTEKGAQDDGQNLQDSSPTSSERAGSAPGCAKGRRNIPKGNNRALFKG